MFALNSTTKRLTLSSLNIVVKRLESNLSSHSNKSQLNDLTTGEKQLLKKNVKPDFGFLFDIDGVFVRGKTVLEQAKECIRLLIDKNGNFRVPTVFLTNAGNELCASKAAKLSTILGVNVRSDQVVMSHTPLKMVKDFHSKHCLISGQGSVSEIASRIGFKSVITVEDLRQYYPHLDVVDHKRRNFAPCVLRRYIHEIEAIILFGESVRWETSLQLIIDVLMCNGKLNESPKEFPKVNLPILACNTDLVWMAEASMPRFGHGTFLHCLEQVYHKLSGNELKYTHIVGKPSGLTYLYAENLINEFAKSIGINQEIKRLYAVGDNLDTDIAGANIYNKLIENNRSKTEENKINSLYSTKAESISSILVRTGVYQGDANDYKNQDLVYSHKDANIDSKFREPNYICDNVFDAVKLVYKLENFN